MKTLTKDELMNINGGDVDWDDVFAGVVVSKIIERGLDYAISLYGAGAVGGVLASIAIIGYGVYKDAQHDKYKGGCVNEYGHQQYAN